MIVSASRRTDIPALYLPWLSRRLQEGFCLVRNPHNPHRISRVDLRPQAVDGMVLWTKNPIPLLQLPAALARIPFYIQCTVTAYGQDLEPGLPPKPEILAAFRELAARLGPARLVWRYDPILFSAAYSLETHVARFADLAAQLEGCTDACIVSFLDSYRCTARAERALGLYRPAPESAQALLRRLVPIARAHGMSVQACAEAADLSALGVERAHCVDPARFARLTGEALRVPRDRSQRLRRERGHRRLRLLPARLRLLLREPRPRGRPPGRPARPGFAPAPRPRGPGCGCGARRARPLLPHGADQPFLTGHDCMYARAIFSTACFSMRET